MQEEAPRPHPDPLIIQYCKLCVLLGIRQPTIHVLAHKVREKHVVAHEPHPAKKLSQKQPPEHSGCTAHLVPSAHW